MYRTVHVKSGDTDPPISENLIDESTALPINLTGKTVTFRMQNMQTGVTVVADGAAAIDDALAGVVHYVWNAGDTDVPGNYKAEWHINDDVLEVGRTFPKQSWIEVVIWKSIPGAG